MNPVILNYADVGFGLDDVGSDKMRDQFDREGWLLIKGFYSFAEIKAVCDYVNHLIELKSQDLGLPTRPDREEGIRIDEYLAICKVNRAKGGEIYKACRNILALHRMAVSQRTTELTSFLMKTDFVNSNPFTALRIDQKDEEKYLFEWHQDYPYTQGSVDGVVIWGNLTDLPLSHGGIKLIPGSHLHGIRKVRLVDPENKNKNGAHTLEIVGKSELEDRPALRVEMQSGDVLVFSTLLLHKSVPMTEGRVRWTFQIRHSNFSHPDPVRRGWPGGMALGEPFELAHPEYIEAN